jgi:hypothetical protein
MVSLNELDERLDQLDISTDEEEASRNQKARKKRKRGLSTICFQYLKGSCKFSKTCTFNHVSATKLESEEKIEIMRELRLRPFDADLARVIANLNIPQCKSFTKNHNCKYDRKCQYWHIDSAAISRWAGFPFWCDACKKGFTSETQLTEHQKGKFHISNLG